MSDDQGFSAGAGATAPGPFEIHYIKSNAFRVIAADGAFGAPTPRGQLNVSLYSERHPIPRIGELAFDESGNGIERVVQTRDGIVREVEISIVLTLGGAESLHEWLGKKVAELKGLLKDAK